MTVSNTATAVETFIALGQTFGQSQGKGESALADYGMAFTVHAREHGVPADAARKGYTAFVEARNANTGDNRRLEVSDQSVSIFGTFAKHAVTKADGFHKAIVTSWSVSEPGKVKSLYNALVASNRAFVKLCEEKNAVTAEAINAVFAEVKLDTIESWIAKPKSADPKGVVIKLQDLAKSLAKLAPEDDIASLNWTARLEELARDITSVAGMVQNRIAPATIEPAETKAAAIDRVMKKKAA